MARSLFSYVVRYDSGFAPNPFHDLCTLATCKPGIRKSAKIGDWLIGTGSSGISTRRGGYLVYAMKVTETLKTSQYWYDSRFRCKRPEMRHNWVSASGDNIYEPVSSSRWRQLHSYHSLRDGRENMEHKHRDLSVERVLVSDDFVYFGGEGPKLHEKFLSGGSLELYHGGQNCKKIRKELVITEFVLWLRSFGLNGYVGKPWDWICRRKRTERSTRDRK